MRSKHSLIRKRFFFFFFFVFFILAGIIRIEKNCGKEQSRGLGRVRVRVICSREAACDDALFLRWENLSVSV